ncbi:hypothetical protein JW826_02530 [Candidatus Woesearchaeota archaeon]|nr:hypothetical protein [Candidatus Woesearchaeota archaeon]
MNLVEKVMAYTLAGATLVGLPSYVRAAEPAQTPIVESGMAVDFTGDHNRDLVNWRIYKEGSGTRADISVSILDGPKRGAYPVTSVYLPSGQCLEIGTPDKDDYGRKGPDGDKDISVSHSSCTDVTGPATRFGYGINDGTGRFKWVPIDQVPK